MNERIGRFHLLKRLGGGGFGEVFLAEDPTIGRQVAIKVFRPKDENLVAFATSSDEEGLQVLRFRFLGEARILAALDDEPHVVNVLDLGELADGTPYYVMPYLPVSLAGELGRDVFDASALEDLPVEERPRALPLERALDVIEQTLAGLAAAHRRGLIHRDIKPGNLMLSESGQIRIVDFGIAKMPDTSHSTVSHLGLGSRNYMAPEQRESAKHVDARADVYAVGVVAYRTLTGKLPIGRFADPNVVVPALGQAMNALLLKMLAQDKADRPANAGEALTAFQQARKGVGHAGTSDTGTWVGDGEAGIRDDLKPLRAHIGELLHRHGSIPAAERRGLNAMAAIANVDDAGLERLILDAIRADEVLQSKSRLVGLIARDVKSAGRALPPAVLAAYESAAQAVGWDRAALDMLARQALEALPVQSPAASKPAAHTAKTNHNAEEPTPGKGKLIGIAVALLVVAGTGFGIYQWRQGQIADAESKRADITRPAAPASPPITDTDRARIRIIQDYLNRLGYRVGETGEADLRTIEAIKRFESEHLVIVTGTPDEVLRLELVKEFDRRDTEAWEKATAAHTDTAYLAYRDAFPKGAHVDKVGELSDAAAWAHAREQDTEAAYQLYLEKYPQGKYFNEVSERILAARARVAEESRAAKAQREADEKKRAEQAELARNGWFRDNGDGTLTDSKTGLKWSQYDNKLEVNLSEAKAYCENRGMVVPTIEQLERIYDPTGGVSTPCGLYECKASPLFKLSSYWFRSDTLSGSSQAWAFNLPNGNRFLDLSTSISHLDYYRVLCVGADSTLIRNTGD